NLTTSPYVYVWDGTHPGAIASDLPSVAPYRIPLVPTTSGGYGVGWMALDGRNVVAECLTSAPHGFKTGQWITMDAGATQFFPCTNGAGSSTVQVTFVNTAFQYPVYVTGAQSFAITLGNMTDGGSGVQPGNVNNIIGSTACSPTFGATLQVPPVQTLPHEAA